MLKILSGTMAIAAACVMTIAVTRAAETSPEGAEGRTRCLSEVPIESAEWKTCLSDCFSSPSADCLLTAAAVMTDTLGDERQADYLRRDISAALAEVGNITAALATVTQIDDGRANNQARARIAIVGAETGDMTTVLRADAPNFVALARGGDEFLADELVGALAKAQARMGNMAGALGTAAITYDPDNGTRIGS